jgi:voltage-gated potassium channel Kch
MRRLAAMMSPASYGSVLILIVITYAVSVMTTERWGLSVVLVVQIATVWLALHVSRARRGVRLLASIALLLAAIVAVANLVWGGDAPPGAWVFLTSALLYFIAPLSILRNIVTHGDVTQETVLGALDAYLLIGMFFAYLYQCIGSIGSAPFFEGGESTLSDVMFFSFTTLTTTGYGNLVPAGNPGQAFAVMEMLLGQLFLISAVAKVINAWRPGRWRRVGGATDTAATPDRSTREQEGGSM